jgi:trans-2,3-dihydro-3-hydroxyanthranilate isomerase
MPKIRRYMTVDVFTERRFGGNQLAVILDAEGLEDALMQRIAAEFGYSETAFLLPPENPGHTARVRIFTPRVEVPFAGHPTVGAAFVAARLGTVVGRPVGQPIQLEEAAGLVEVTLLWREGVPAGAVLSAPQALHRGPEVAVEIVAECLGLERAEITTVAHAPMVASVGLPFVFAEATDLSALAHSRPHIAACERYLPIEGADAFHLYVRERQAPDLVRARVFSPLDGIMEDPATGSANAALIALLADLAPAADLDLSLSVQQGVEMGRPSLLEAQIRKRAGVLSAPRIGGFCVPVMEGEIAIDWG